MAVSAPLTKDVASRSISPIQCMPICPVMHSRRKKEIQIPILLHQVSLLLTQQKISPALSTKCLKLFVVTIPFLLGYFQMPCICSSILVFILPYTPSSRKSYTHPRREIKKNNTSGKNSPAQSRPPTLGAYASGTRHSSGRGIHRLMKGFLRFPASLFLLPQSLFGDMVLAGVFGASKSCFEAIINVIVGEGC